MAAERSPRGRWPVVLSGLAALLLAAAPPAASQARDPLGAGLRSLEAHSLQAEAHLRAGLAALEEGSWEEVARLFRAGLEALQPPARERVQERFRSGLEALDRGDRQSAEQHLRAGLRALGETPAAEDPKDIFRDGLQARDRGAWSAAVDLFRRAAELRPGDGVPVNVWEKGGNIANWRGVSEPYLPRYFAVEALIRDGRCDEALAEREALLAAGKVPGMEAAYRKMDRLMAEECE